jgi:DNA-directed RNA polymerase specialized sigma24 family protein
MEGIDYALEVSYRAITRKTCRDCAGTHPQFEDIVGTASVNVWSEVSRQPIEQRPFLHRLVRIWARQGVCHFMRSQENAFREYRRAGKGEPGATVPVPYVNQWSDSLQARWEARAQPDFAPRLIRRLWLEWVWADLWQRATEKDREFLRLYFGQGCSYAEVQVLTGRGVRNTWARLKELTARYREC